VSPETDEIGIGAIKPERMKKAIGTLVETYTLPNTPTVADIFDASFLPPKAARELKLAM
jgi:NitT/TauT family transport system substrate-binding protein